MLIKQDKASYPFSELRHRSKSSILNKHSRNGTLNDMSQKYDGVIRWWKVYIYWTHIKGQLKNKHKNEPLF